MRTGIANTPIASSSPSIRSKHPAQHDQVPAADVRRSVTVTTRKTP